MCVSEDENEPPFFRRETVSLLGPLEKGQVKNEALRELRVELSRKHQARGLDGFGLYL